jgi:pimeloyl-ACP methyl ester carboxylesterase
MTVTRIEPNRTKQQERYMELYIQETGSFGAPMVLFLHGSPLSSRMWQPQLDTMKDFHCVAPDLPGHGQSAAVKRFEMKALVDTLADLIRSTSPTGKAHVVGLSFGGVVAQALMVNTPELIDHVVLSGTATRLNKLLIFSQALNAPVMRLLRPQQLASIISSQFGIPAVFKEQLKEDFHQFSADVFMQVMWTYADIVMPSSTTSPTLITVGEKETFFAKNAALALCKGIPGARGVLVPGMGHVWNLQAPELFTEMLRAWLQDQPLPAGLLPLGS